MYTVTAMNPASAFRSCKGHFVVAVFELVSGEALDGIAREKFPFCSERLGRLRLEWASFGLCGFGVSSMFAATGPFVCRYQLFARKSDRYQREYKYQHRCWCRYQYWRWYTLVLVEVLGLVPVRVPVRVPISMLVLLARYVWSSVFCV